MRKLLQATVVVSTSWRTQSNAMKGAHLWICISDQTKVRMVSIYDKMFIINILILSPNIDTCCHVM